MSSSVPQTPTTARVRGSRTNTPRSIKKKTILTNNYDQSDLEEEDQTYVYQGSASEEEDESYEEDDILDDVSEEGSLSDDNTTEVESEVTNEKDIKETPESVQPTKTLIDIDLEPAADSSKFHQFLVKHEVVRKGLHSSFGFVTLFFYSVGISQRQLVMPLIGLFAVIFANDYIRFQNPELNKKIVKRFYYLIRERELNHYNGTLYYLAGLVMVFSVLPKDISMMSVLLLSWADTAASTFGRRFGKYTFQIAKGKSFAGAVASFITGVISCYILYGYAIPRNTAQVDTAGDILWNAADSKLNYHVYALVCGLVASFSECVNLYGLDDNFTIPVVSGYLLNGLVRVFRT